MKHLFDRWPYDPLPSPVRYDDGSGPCNAEYRVNDVLVGHCSVTVRMGQETHRGNHRIEWPNTVQTQNRRRLPWRLRRST